MVCMLVEKITKYAIELDGALQHRKVPGLLDDYERAIRNAIAERP